MNRNSFRDGIGLGLDLTPCEENKFEEFLKNYSLPFVFPIITCVTPIWAGLNNLGYIIPHIYTPDGLKWALIDSGLVIGTYYYPASK